jgi:putative ABC transport system permease protein
MFLNYLKTAFRMMVRQKLPACINITGLAVGLSSALFIFMYIYDELQYDKYHEYRETVFRVIGNLNNPNIRALEPRNLQIRTGQAPEHINT